jgi:hypothetical protein
MLAGDRRGPLPPSPAWLPSEAVRIIVAAGLAGALAAPASASAATITARLDTASVRYGHAHTVTGKLLEAGQPLAGKDVVLEGRRYPFRGSFRVIKRSRTDAKGGFRFTVKLDRNHRLRVAAGMLESAVLRAYTLPAIALSSRAVAPGVTRLTQRYTVPKIVKLSAPTLFYLGSRHAKHASMRRTGALRRTRAGHYISSVTVTLPASWHGAFRYASCFRASPYAGMGDARQSCPRLRFEF